MKRVGYLFDQIVDPDNIRLAFWKTQRGKSEKAAIQKFRQNLDAHLAEIRDAFLTGDFRLGNYTYFPVFDPKERMPLASEEKRYLVRLPKVRIASIAAGAGTTTPATAAPRTATGTIQATATTTWASASLSLPAQGQGGCRSANRRAIPSPCGKATKQTGPTG